MDVHTAFLQGDLDEEIYMKQPDGDVDEENPNHVCKLKKSLYGLSKRLVVGTQQLIVILNQMVTSKWELIHACISSL